jgi:hypothetical protein
MTVSTPGSRNFPKKFNDFWFIHAKAVQITIYENKIVFYIDPFKGKKDAEEKYTF